MICTKCHTDMRFINAGYAGAKAQNNCEATPLGGHWSCWCCGKLVEVTPETTIDPSLKGSVQPKPLSNKVYNRGEVIGAIRTVVLEQWVLVSSMKRDCYSWPVITAKLKELYPHVLMNQQTVMNAYHRINNGRRTNEQHKSTRLDRKPYTKKVAHA